MYYKMKIGHLKKYYVQDNINEKSVLLFEREN